jgi:hypothetical protein
MRDIQHLLTHGQPGRSFPDQPALKVPVESPAGAAPPAVPHVAFRDAAFREIGHFRERPESLTAYLEEESRNFRVRLRMQERDRVRTETLAGLLAAASASH